MINLTKEKVSVAVGKFNVMFFLIIVQNEKVFFSCYLAEIKRF